MGITGLIPFLEKASSKINIKDLKGCTVAIDTYCWLHKGAYGCAEKLSRGEKTNVHILYCLKFVNMLLSLNIKPIMVFDGRHLPAKALTENRRRENRDQAKKRAAELLRLGRIDEARIQMRRCIDITHDMVLELIQECRKRNVDCIVAPYEADAQLAYLNKKNISQYVITEDSDLTLFGANKIIFKLDLTGNCLLVEADKLHLAMGCKPEKYTFEKFRKMCILSGCDYLDSLPGIGLAKACKFILKTEETDTRRALKKLPQYLNMRNLTVTDDYIEDFLKAEATFMYMFVYNPFERKMVRLNEIQKDMKNFEVLCSNAGTLLDNTISFNLALGNLNPFTLKELDNWNPDFTSNSTSRNWQQNTSKTKHSSIWEPNYKPHTIKKQTSINAFSFKKINYQFIDDSENSENEIDNESALVSLYSENEPPSKRRKHLTSPNIFEDNSYKVVTDNENKHNPFAKLSLENSPENNSSINQLNLKESKLCKLERLSQFKRTIVDNSKEIKSRFFPSNTVPIKELSEKNKTIENDSEINNDCDAIQEIPSFIKSTDQNEFIKEFISTSDHENTEENETNSNSNEIVLKSFEYNAKQISRNKTENDSDIIEISDAENIITEEITKRTTLRVGLSKKSSKLKYDNSDSQTRLSMFGFKKKTTIQR